MKKFLDLPIEQQVSKIIRWAFIFSIFIGLVCVYLAFGLQQMIAFALLAIVCIPISIVWSKLKSSVKKSFIIEEEEDGYDS